MLQGPMPDYIAWFDRSLYRRDWRWELWCAGLLNPMKIEAAAESMHSNFLVGHPIVAVARHLFAGTP
jgi:hypothetical protein